MDQIYNFLQLVIFAFLALLPVVNPFGTALMLESMLSSLSPKQRAFAAKKIAINSFGVCIVSLLIGSWILKLFGLSIGIMQVTGGILIIKTGFDLLNSKDTNDSKDIEIDEIQSFKNLEDKLFYPYAFPIMTGAGTISVLFTLAAQGNAKGLSINYFTNMLAIIFGVFLMVLLIYISISKAHLVISRMGSKLSGVISKVSAFLVLAVGLQIFTSGILGLVKANFPNL